MIKIYKDGLSSREQIFCVSEPKMDVSAIVSEIIEKVKKEGDKALYFYAEKFDKVQLSSLLVSKEEIQNAVNLVEPEFIEILKKSAKIAKKCFNNSTDNAFERLYKDNINRKEKNKLITTEDEPFWVTNERADYLANVRGLVKIIEVIPDKVKEEETPTEEVKEEIKETPKAKPKRTKKK